MELEKIGENAGKVWHVLNEGRELTIPELSRRIDLSNRMAGQRKQNLHTT